MAAVEICTGINESGGNGPLARRVDSGRDPALYVIHLARAPVELADLISALTELLI